MGEGDDHSDASEDAREESTPPSDDNCSDASVAMEISAINLHMDVSKLSTSKHHHGAAASLIEATDSCSSVEVSEASSSKYHDGDENVNNHASSSPKKRSPKPRSRSKRRRRKSHIRQSSH